MNDFYQSECPDVEFVTDPEVRKAPGRGLVIETTEAWKTIDVEIHLLFGGTEIKVTCVNRTSNRQQLFNSGKNLQKFLSENDFRNSSMGLPVVTLVPPNYL